MARKILLADDSVTAQNMGRKILVDAGYEVVTVNNGSAALKRVGEIKPDLVVLDVYMPGYSGLEVCQRLKESAETLHIPVLLSVGKLEPFKPDEARRVGADAHIVKPFEASELLTAIGRLEDHMVPQEPEVPGVAHPGENRADAAGNQGSKNRISLARDDDKAASAGKSSEREEPVADSRKGGTEPEAASKVHGGVSLKAAPPAGREPGLVPDVPRDITPVGPVAAVSEGTAQPSVDGLGKHSPEIATGNTLDEDAAAGTNGRRDFAVFWTSEASAVGVADVSGNVAAAHPAEEETNRVAVFAPGVAPAGEDELAAALRLLTPAATGGGQAWVAQSVAPTMEEAAASLEAEMFLAFAPSSPALVPLGAAEVGVEGSQTPTASAITAAAAVETRLSEAGMAARESSQAPVNAAKWTLVKPRAAKAGPEDGLAKAMAASAGEGADFGADFGSANASHAETIAQLVDSVMADLRPRIMEEITRKLAGK